MMRKNRNALQQGLRACSLVLLCAASVLSQASFDAVKGSASPAQITSTATTTVNFAWQVEVSGTEVGGSAESTEGVFIDPRNGNVLNTIITGVATTGGTTVLPATEVLTLPSAFLQSWKAQKLPKVLYRRTFDSPVGGASATGFVTINLQNLQSALSREVSQELQLQRLTLNFTQGEQYAMVARASGLRAQLGLEYRGQGTLNGQWQVASVNMLDDVNSANQAFYTLRHVRKLLNAGQVVQLKSPDLPTNTVGRYLLRFCVTAASGVGCQQPMVTIGYQVLGDSAGVVNIVTDVFPKQGRVTADTAFQWPAVDNAAVYQLQVFKRSPGSSSVDPQHFVTGMWLPGKTPATKLSTLAQQKLTAGGEYAWRLVVFDQSGTTLARSEYQLFTWHP